MSKPETEKEILALRYPIDVDVTEDIVKKRLVCQLKVSWEFLEILSNKKDKRYFSFLTS